MTHREEIDALFNGIVKKCDKTQTKRKSGHCIGCQYGPQCPWYQEDW